MSVPGTQTLSVKVENNLFAIVSMWVTIKDVMAFTEQEVFKSGVGLFVFHYSTYIDHPIR